MANDFIGMSRDTRRNKIPPGMWEFARNILLTKGYKSVANEDGFEYKHTVPGSILGVIESNDEVVYLSLDGEYSCIGYVNTNTDDETYILILRTINPEFRFDITRPIEGVYTYNFRREMIIAFCDGVLQNSHSPKLLNIHNPQIELDANGELINQDQIGLLNLFPIANEGIINVSYDEEGFLDADVIYLTYAYVYQDNTETLFYPIHKISYLSTGIQPLEKRSLNIEIEELDTNFSKLRLGLVVKTDEGFFAYQSNIFNYTGTIFNTTVTSLTNYETISTDELVLNKEIFDRIQTMTIQNNQLIIGHTVKEELTEFQKYANMLELELFYIDNSDIINNTDIHNYANFMPDEVYAMYIEVQLLNGTYSRGFHLPGRTFIGDERDIISNVELESMGLDDLTDQNYRRFHLFNNGDFIDLTGNNPPMIFGYWENLETYPNIDEYDSSIDYEGLPLGGEDLRGAPIRYHRFPGLDTFAKYLFDEMANDQDVSDFIPRFGIRISNFDSIVPAEILSQIQGYRLSFVKRNRGDSLIETNTALVRAVNFSNEFDGVDYDTESTYVAQPSGLADRTVMNTLYENEFGKCKTYNNDLYKFTPTIDPTLIKANYAFKIDIDGEAPTLVEGGLINDDQRYALFRNVEYLPEDNIEGRTRFTEQSIVLEFHNYLNGVGVENIWRPTNLTIVFITPVTEVAIFQSNLYTWDAGTQSYVLDQQIGDISLTFGLNATMINLQKNVYAGFRSTDLVVIGRTNLNNSNVMFREGGDVFTNNEVDLTIQHNIGCNTRTRLRIQGLRSVTNNTRLYTQEPPEEAGDGDSELCPDNNDDLNVLNSLDYTVEVEGRDVLSSINDLAAIITFSVNDDFIDYFPYRINRGLNIPNETLKTRALRTFLPEDFYEMKNDRGPIIALRGTNRRLYIQQQFSLFIAMIKDRLETGEVGTETFLGESDLFDRIPDEVLYNNDKGYVGCTSQFACFVYKDGYVTIDQIQGKIFIVGNSSREISKLNMRNYFRDNLDIGLQYFENDRFGTPRRVDNPFVNVGHLASFDDDYNRLIFTKKFFRFLFPDLIGVDYTFDGQLYRDNLGNILDFNNTELFENLSETFSFGLDQGKETWICNHDYFPNAMYYSNTGIYSIISSIGSDARVYRHNDPDTKGLYYGERFESYIDIVFAKRVDLFKIYQAFYWITEVVEADNRKTQSETIDAVVVYNDYQCSGRLDIRNGKFDITRVVETNRWQFDEFRDLVNNRELPFILETGEIIEDNINQNKSWFTESNFISNFIVIRLIIDNTDDKEKYIHNINVKSRITKR